MDITVTNIVVNGNLDQEIDCPSLQTLFDDTDGFEAEYFDMPLQSLEVYPQKDNTADTINVYRSGKYKITGNKKDLLQNTNKEFLKVLYNNEIIESPDNVEFAVHNIVVNFDRDESVNLDTFYTQYQSLSSYNSESFPAVTVSKDLYTANVFSTGTVTLMGVSDKKQLKKAFEDINSMIDNIETGTDTTDGIPAQFQGDTNE